MTIRPHEGTPETDRTADPAREIARLAVTVDGTTEQIAAAADGVLATASPCKAYRPLELAGFHPEPCGRHSENDEADRGAPAPDEARRDAMVDTDRATGTVKEFTGAAQRTVGDAVGSPGNSVEGRSREAEGQVEQFYGRAKEAIRQGAGRVADVARDAYGDPASYARKGADTTGRQVEGNPLVAVLIAGAAGYLASYLLHGKH